MPVRSGPMRSPFARVHVAFRALLLENAPWPAAGSPFFSTSDRRSANDLPRGPDWEDRRTVGADPVHAWAGSAYRDASTGGACLWSSRQVGELELAGVDGVEERPRSSPADRAARGIAARRAAGTERREPLDELRGRRSPPGWKRAPR